MGDGPQAGMLENPVPALGDPTLARAATPSDWYLMVTQGNMQNFMPPFKSLADQQRWDVVAYALSLSVSPEDVATGATLFQENYADCFGEDGSAGDLDFSDLEAMSQTSTVDIVATLDQSSCNSVDLTEADQWAVAGYVRSLTAMPFVGAAELEFVEGEAEPEDGSQPETEAGAPAEDIDSTPGTGAIHVEVIPTGEVDLPANLEVVLRGYEAMNEVFSQTLTLETGNVVIFEEIPLTKGRIYFATIEHANAAYGSDILEMELDATDLNLLIEYFEPTTDVGILSVDRLHLFLDFVDDQTLEVFQLYIFSNPGSQVLIPEEGMATAIEFIIPAEASNLSVEENMSMAFRKTEAGFGITNVYPNENPYQVVFSYQVPYPEKKLELTVPIGMDANAVIVMAPSGGFKVNSEILVAGGTQEFNGVPYNMFNGSNLQAGTPLEMTLSGRPRTETNFFAPTDDNSNTSLVIGLAGFGAMLIGTGIYLWRRNAGDDDLLDDEFDEIYEDEIDSEPETTEDLMDAIIALDDQFKAGDLPERAYQERRAELKEKLLELLG